MKKRTKVLITCLWLAVAGTGAGLSSLAGMFLYLSPKLPSVASIREVKLETPLRIFSADKKLIGEIGEYRRQPVSIDLIPDDLKNAIIATEDEDFYEHSGVSLKGIARAVYTLLKTGRKGPGGSTITMQITRHEYLHLRQEFTRKFNEIILARKIEQELTKDQILELYCNYMFLGKRAWGVEAAAQVYYGKSLADLDLAQLAMIAGIFQAPSSKNPINNPERAIERRNYVLSRMFKEGFIDQARYEEAIAKPVTARQHGQALDISAPYVTEMARLKAVELWGQAAYKDGYEIYTSVDSRLQETAQKAVVNGIMAYDQRHGYRGPEKQLDPADLVILTDDNGNETFDYTPWLENLSAIPTYAGLTPAIVTAVNEDSIAFLFADNTTVALPWEGKLSETRPYVNENVRNPAPKTPAELLAVGDVVRLIKVDGTAEENKVENQEEEGQQENRGENPGWQLSQLPAVQGSLVSLNPDNGAILALVGGFDYYHSNFNRITQAERQPGSNFKPFIYTTALEQGMTAATVINDAPVVSEYDSQLENDWRPTNDDHTFSGPTRLRKALYGSKNLVSIRVLRQIGVGETVRSLVKYGFDEESIPRDLTLSLGSLGLTPLKLVTGYAVFANGGYRVEPWLIERITNLDGETVYIEAPLTVCQECEDEESADEENESGKEIHATLNAGEEAVSEAMDSAEDSDTGLSDDDLQATDLVQSPVLPNAPYEFSGDPFDLPFIKKYWLGIVTEQDYPRAERVVDERVAYIIDSMLRDVIRQGTGVRAKKLGRNDLAGKTGTTNGPNDVWFSGYNGNVVTTTWIGFDQFTPLGNREYGGTAALPIWMDYMEVALKGKPETIRPQPQGIVSVRINPETGERARVDDPDAIFEIFRAEHVPEPKENTPDPGTPWSEEGLTEDLF